LDQSASPYDQCPAYVHKLLDRREWIHQPEAVQAVKDEGQALVEEGTWDLSSVRNKKDLINDARATGKKINYGDLMPICSIKHWESIERRKHKGRIVFRGDNVKDENNAFAVFQELSASPASIHSANSAMAYGIIPGHKITQADAIRAYVQSYLKTKCETWVSIPRELWPDEWYDENGVPLYERPMCRLIKALYGHPESGGHWERHLEEAITAIGGEKIEGHQSSFYFKDSRLVLTVYVDDLLLAGPTEEHDAFWQKLRFGPNPIKLEDPEPLNRFLGREHKLI